jgi:hypothetical protein
MDKMIVPSNFMSWPRIADLLPDQKLIARELWCNVFCRPHGCYALSIPMFSASLSLTAASVLEALRDFERRELIIFDEVTSEIYIMDWLRFHTFSGWAIGNYWKGVSDIRSPRLKKIVTEKSVVFGMELPPSTKPKSCLKSVVREAGAYGVACRM